MTGARLLTRIPLSLRSRSPWYLHTPVVQGIILRQSRFFSYPPHEVVGLPSLSPTMESGSIASWNLKEGDTFAAGDVMCSVETDKATVDFEAQDDGRIAKILVEAGPDEIRCGQPILVTVEEGEDVSAFADFTVENAGGGASNEASKPSVVEPQPTSEGSSPPPTLVAPAPAVATNPGGRVIASPLAHMLAKDMGYDLGSISGTGPGGRIIAADVKEYVPDVVSRASSAEGQPSSLESPIPQATLSDPPVQGHGRLDFPITEPARVAAGRLAQSKRNVPHYYLTVDIAMDNVLEIRTALNATLGESDQPGLGVYEFLLKAAACSMKAVPAANACWMDSVVRVYDSVDINVVLGQGDSLCMPVIRDCGEKGIASISDELVKTTTRLEENGDGQVLLPLEAGTFSVVNVGMFGVKSCAPIIREPQACALALGSLENRIVPNEDKNSEDIFKESVFMTATLSCDHRVVDGAVGAQWLSAFKSFVENPTTLLL